MINQSFTHAIGNTPLIRIPFNNTNAQIYAKLEYLNPGGSIKDRSALYMIEQAEKSGSLKPGGTIIDASSGNHGIAVAMIGAQRGYRVIICVSEKISKEKQDTLRAYGAELVVCPSTLFLEDPRSYHSKAMQIHQETPGSVMLNQYFNTQNRDAHYKSLGPEIWRQTEGKVTHFFAGAGTGGTISGAGLYLKEQNPAIQIIAVDAKTSWYSTQGNPQPYKLEGLGIDFDSPVFMRSTIDHVAPVSDEESIAMLKYLARYCGMLVGPSSGAVAAAVGQFAPQLPDNAVVVMIFGDSGRAYLTKEFYREQETPQAHVAPRNVSTENENHELQ